MEDLTGRQFGPYQIVEPLGEGGMAAVYKAFQPNMERYVALKVLPQYYARDPEFTGRFSQEARLIASLQHPHILPVHDFGEDEGYTYLVMPFVAGGTLDTVLADGHPLPLDRLRRIVGQVGDALDYAHSRGIIHRDIKPSNVLLDRRGNCLLSDFGVAKMVESNIQFTKTGGIVGTPAYMSPEQSLGQTLDRRSDIYSLGVLLYQMATGRPPYRAETPVALLLKHAHEPLPPPQRQNPSLPDEVAAVILKALAKDPADRYETAGAMVRALQSAVDSAQQRRVSSSPPTPAVQEETFVAPPEVEPTGSVVQPAPVGPSQTDAEEVAREAIRNRRPWLWLGAGGGLIIVACIAVIALSFLFSGRDGPDAGTVVDEELAEEEEAVAPDEDEDEVSPEADNANQVFETVSEGEQAWADGNLDHAAGLLTEGIALAPEEAPLYCTRGLIFRDADDFERAAEDLEQCSALAEAQGDVELLSHAGAHLAITEARLEKEDTGDLQQALTIIDSAMQDPNAPAWLICERGQMAFDHGADDIAIEDFSACLESVDDEGWQSHVPLMLAVAQTNQALTEGRASAALQHAEEWAELAPEEPWPHCHMGDLYFWDFEEWDAALAAYDRCAALAGDEDTRLWALFNIPQVEAFRERESGNYEMALEFYSEALVQDPTAFYLHCEQADILLYEMGDPEGATLEAEQCLRSEDPGIREWAEDILNEIEANY